VTSVFLLVSLIKDSLTRNNPEPRHVAPQKSKPLPSSIRKSY